MDNRVRSRSSKWIQKAYQRILVILLLLIWTSPSYSVNAAVTLDTSQISTLYNPPVMVIPDIATSTASLTPTLLAGTQPTGTPTPTTTLTPIPGTAQTPTKTVTVTPLQSSPTINFGSPSVSPSVQGSVSPTPSPNPQEVFTVTPSVPVTATTTLIPLPPLTLVFPTLTPLPTSTRTPLPSIQQRLVNLGAARIIIVGIILVIWITLGGWFYISLRRLE